MVEVNPEPRQARDLVVPVAVTVAPAKRTVYTAGALYGTDTGAGIEAGVRRRWLNRHGHKVAFDTLLAQRLKNAALTYTIPRPGQDNKAFNFGANWLDSNTATSRSRTLGLVANESREWRGFSSSFGLNALSGDYVVGGENGNSTLLYAEASLGKKKGANPVYVRNGWAVSAVGRAGGPLSTTAFTQLALDGTWIHTLAPRNRIILRGAAGATWVQDFNALPPQLRFFAGGDRSIRGYGYQTVGPRNAQGLVIGGRDLLVASATYEHYFLPKWGVALFADGGDAFNSGTFQMHQAIGFGLRWISPVGPVRVDFGFPIGDRYAHGLSLHISIGPDL
jgi:translocation and assembly module TamA